MGETDSTKQQCDWTMIHAASIVNADCWLCLMHFEKYIFIIILSSFWTNIFIGGTNRALLEHELMKNENENNIIWIVDGSRWNNKHGNDDTTKKKQNI